MLRRKSNLHESKKKKDSRFLNALIILRRN